MNKRNLIITSVLCIGLIVVARIIPHVPNVAPVTAVAILLGARLNKRYAVAVPLIAMLISDALVGWYDWRLMTVVYGSFAVIATFGHAIRNHKTPWTILGTSIASSVFFFLTTNVAVWALSDWYPNTVAGLLACYSFALPFFRYSLVGDIFYTSILFTIPSIVTLLAQSYQSLKAKWLLENL